MSQLTERVSAEIKTAMKEKNEKRKIALRSIKTAFETLEKGKGDVDENARLKAIQGMVKQRNESASIFKAQNREDLYAIEMYELDVLNEFLPKQMTTDEIIVEVENTISSLGLNISELQNKDFGKIMGVLSKKLTGKAQSSIISDIIKTYIK